MIQAFRRTDKTKSVWPEFYFLVKVPYVLLRPKRWSLPSCNSHHGCYLPMQEQCKGKDCGFKLWNVLHIESCYTKKLFEKMFVSDTTLGWSSRTQSPCTGCVPGTLKPLGFAWWMLRSVRPHPSAQSRIQALNLNMCYIKKMFIYCFMHW